MSFDCPHCLRSLGGPAAQNEGEFKVRLGIVLIDPTSGRVHGPCIHCKRDVTIADGAKLSKAFSQKRVRLGLPIS